MYQLSDMIIQDVINLFCFLMNEMFFCLEQVKDVHMIVLRHSSEEVYDGRFAGIFVWLCVQLFSYVGLYEDVDVDDWYESIFS